MDAIFNKNGRHYGKNQNFQKRRKKILENHKMSLLSKFRANWMNAASETPRIVSKYDSEKIAINYKRRDFPLKMNFWAPKFDQILIFVNI